MKTSVTPLPYIPDPLPYYAERISQPYAFAITGGRYTIMGWDPVEVITDHPDPFAYMQERLRDFTSDISPCGGWYGYLGYEMAEGLHGRLEARPRDLPVPDMCMGLYENVIVFDHDLKKAYGTQRLLHNSSLREGTPTKHSRKYNTGLLRPRVLGLAMTNHATTPYEIRQFMSNFTPASYQSAFEKIQVALRRGDCYQVNLAQRFSADFEGDSWAYFLHMMKNNPAPFAAYINLPEGAVISCSPERFIRIEQNRIFTQPIKGTCAREADPKQLQHSEKNRAENLMIVDLMRNDLGKICVAGSVQVPHLFAIESYQSVHHLVSTITGLLKPDITPLHALKSCFPGGSITGAPKLAAMQQIRALEPHARHIYCGNIGYADFSGVVDMNIAIRTALITQGQCHVWAGGGIVLDSLWEDEYQECLDKIRPFLHRSQPITHPSGDTKNNHGSKNAVEHVV